MEQIKVLNGEAKGFNITVDNGKGYELLNSISWYAMKDDKGIVSPCAVCYHEGKYQYTIKMQEFIAGVCEPFIVQFKDGDRTNFCTNNLHGIAPKASKKNMLKVREGLETHKKILNKNAVSLSLAQTKEDWVNRLKKKMPNMSAEIIDAEAIKGLNWIKENLNRFDSINNGGK